MGPTHGAKGGSVRFPGRWSAHPLELCPVDVAAAVLVVLRDEGARVGQPLWAGGGGSHACEKASESSASVYSAPSRFASFAQSSDTATVIASYCAASSRVVRRTLPNPSAAESIPSYTYRAD